MMLEWHLWLLGSGCINHALLWHGRSRVLCELPEPCARGIHARAHQRCDRTTSIIDGECSYTPGLRWRYHYRCCGQSNLYILSASSTGTSSWTTGSFEQTVRVSAALISFWLTLVYRLHAIRNLVDVFICMTGSNRKRRWCGCISPIQREQGWTRVTHLHGRFIRLGENSSNRKTPQCITISALPYPRYSITCYSEKRKRAPQIHAFPSTRHRAVTMCGQQWPPPTGHRTPLSAPWEEKD